MKIGIPRETASGETRVAVVPETVKRLASVEGQDVLVQAGAGDNAFLSDEIFTQAGAQIANDEASVWQADLVIKVAAPSMGTEGSDDEIAKLKEGAVFIATFAPLVNHDLVRRLAEARVTSFSMDAIPRITRAQSMDVLSSMSTIAGYKAVLMAADHMAKMVPMMMTAAGTLQPANALVIGAGVAGLQAIATAKRIGAQVKAVDVRPAVQEQVESLGAKFVPMEVDHSAEDAGGYATDLGEDFYKGEQDILAPHVKGSDLIVTTALIPGRPAPKLITQEMVESMKPGSVIVDLAAIAGGNCTLTQAGQTVTHNGVTILGPENLAAEVPVHASMMYARNVLTFLGEFLADGKIDLDMDNEVVAGTLITRDGEIVHAATRKAMGLEPLKQPEPEQTETEQPTPDQAESAEEGKE